MSRRTYHVTSHESCHSASIMSCRTYHVTSHIACHVARIMSHRMYHVTSHVSRHIACIMSHRTYHVTSHVSCHIARIMSHRTYHAMSHASCHIARIMLCRSSNPLCAVLTFSLSTRTCLVDSNDVSRARRSSMVSCNVDTCTSNLAALLVTHCRHQQIAHDHARTHIITTTTNCVSGAAAVAAGSESGDSVLI
jgi:hypothetical protein